jgi:hypothetical protein
MSNNDDDETVINRSTHNTVLPREIVDAFNLTPMVENVMMHAATRRARDTLQKLVKDDATTRVVNCYQIAKVHHGTSKDEEALKEMIF